jgi:hypothetical protein
MPSRRDSLYRTQFKLLAQRLRIPVLAAGLVTFFFVQKPPQAYISRSQETHCHLEDMNVSPAQEAYCLLGELNISPVDLPEVCQDSNLSDVECIDKLYAQNKSVRKVNCVPSDFTDVQIQSKVLMSLRAVNDIREFPRQTLKPDNVFFQRVLLTICVKNEGRLLIISIIWHLLLGVDHVFVCNHSTPGGVDLRKILRPIVDIGFVTIKDYSGVGAIQQTCYDDALEFARAGGYIWQGGLDADEFLVVSQHFGNAQNFFSASSSLFSRAREHDIGALGINWIMQPIYLQNFVQYPEDLHTTPAKKVNFVLGQPNAHVKSFALVNRTKRWGHVHFPQVFNSENVTTVNTEGISLASIEVMFATPPAVTDAAILHFSFRTIQEHMAKRERGRATFDCESEKSKNDPPCSMIHRIRDSPHGISLAAEEYLSHYKPPEQRTPFVYEADFSAVMRKLSAQVEEVIPCMCCVLT